MSSAFAVRESFLGWAPKKKKIKRAAITNVSEILP